MCVNTFLFQYFFHSKLIATFKILFKFNFTLGNYISFGWNIVCKSLIKVKKCVIVFIYVVSNLVYHFQVLKLFCKVLFMEFVFFYLFLYLWWVNTKSRQPTLKLLNHFKLIKHMKKLSKLFYICCAHGVLLLLLSFSFRSEK